MKDIGIVCGSEEQAKPIVINGDVVYVHEDIQRVDREDDAVVYEYHEYQGTRDEYLEMMHEQNGSVASKVSEIEVATPSLMAVASMYVNDNVSMTTSQAVSVIDFIDEWAAGMVYPKGKYLRYQGKLYRTAQEINPSYEHYAPGVGMESLYTLIDLADDGIRVWHMPTDATNSFALGEICHYPDADGQIYVSQRNGNTSEPGTDEWWVLRDE